ncbi:hypothetical protein PSACC_01133, partial [Paramicrosporidium saccamoebae]
RPSHIQSFRRGRGCINLTRGPTVKCSANLQNALEEGSRYPHSWSRGTACLAVCLQARGGFRGSAASIHPERQVRELAHSCLEALVRNNKRWVSPIIKSLFYPWFGGLLDSVGSVAIVAETAFNACFGPDKKANVFQVATPIIVQEACAVLSNRNQTKSDEELERAYEVTHAYNAVSLLLAESQAADYAAELTTIANYGLRDAAEHQDSFVRASIYRFARSLIERSASALVSWGPLVDIAILDLRTSNASLAIPFIRLSTLDRRHVEKLCTLLAQSLPTQVPKSSIPDIASILQSCDIAEKAQITKCIWAVVLGYKSLDTSRLASIWNLYLHCVLHLPETTPLLNDAWAYCIAANPQISSIRSFALHCFAETHPFALHDLVASYFNSKSASPKEKIALSLQLPASLDLTESMDILMDVFSCSPCEEQFLTIKSIIQSTAPAATTTTDLSKVRRTLFSSYFKSVANTNEQLECLVSEISLSAPTKQQVFLDLMLAESNTWPTEAQLTILTLLLSKLNVASSTKVDCLVGVLACKGKHSLVTIKAVAGLAADIETTHIINSFRILPDGPERIASLTPLAVKALEEENVQFAIAYLISVAAKLDCQMNMFTEKQFETTIKCVATLPLYAVSDIVLQSLLHFPSLWSLAFDQAITLDPELVARIRAHLTSSIGLCSYPFLLEEGEFPTAIWKENTELIDHLCKVLEHATTMEAIKATVITLAVFKVCLQEEHFYSIDSALTRRDCSLTSVACQWKEDILCLALEHRGFYLVFASQVGVCIDESRFLALGSLSFGSLVNKVSGLPEELSYEKALLYMSTDVEWGRGELFQLLASIVDLPAGLQSQAVLARFLARHFSHVNGEYWLNHSDVIVEILRTMLAECQKDLVRHHVFISHSLQLAREVYLNQATRSMLQDLLEPIWNTLKCFELQNRVAVLESLENNFAQLVVALGRALDSVTTPGAICDALFATKSIVLKLACRRLIMGHLDDCLEQAKVKLAKMKRDSMAQEEEYESLRDSLLIPWDSMGRVLFASSWSIDDFLALDLFLCLSEGSKEEQVLSGPYCTLFKEKLLSKYLTLLSVELGWDTTTPDDLSKEEFTILDFDSTIQRFIYAANLLFRCFKTFPSAVRSWYSGLSKEESVRIIKYCTMFMSPLLIERELARIRKSSNDQLTMRVEQTSTSCTVNVQYMLEEFSFSLQLSVPTEYPLKPVTLAGGERLGISEAKWRSWLLSVQTLLNQNLAIVEVLQQWKTNAEKTLAGVEPCAICYCVLQPGDKSLPGPSCKTCRNKFHSACLYRWFKTGGQATCPMCRALY